jgi:DNA-binding transcriptional MerR regulator
MNALDIGEVVERSGLPASALRYYEERGLIRSVGRRGLRRLYGADVLERLALIALGRSVGFSLDEISGMLVPGQGLKIDRQRLARRADELDVTVRRLGALRDGLRHAAVCPARSHMECPSFQRLLKLAAAGVIQPLETPAKPKRGAAEAAAIPKRSAESVRKSALKSALNSALKSVPKSARKTAR